MVQQLSQNFHPGRLANLLFAIFFFTFFLLYFIFKHIIRKLARKEAFSTSIPSSNDNENYDSFPSTNNGSNLLKTPILSKKIKQLNYLMMFCLFASTLNGFMWFNWLNAEDLLPVTLTIIFSIILMSTLFLVYLPLPQSGSKPFWDFYRKINASAHNFPGIDPNYLFVFGVYFDESYVPPEESIERFLPQIEPRSVPKPLSKESLFSFISWTWKSLKIIAQTKIKAHPRFTGISLLFIAIFCIFTGVFFSGICYNYDTTSYFSTRFTRKYYLPPGCPSNGEPCHVYLTGGSDLTSRMIVNFHSTDHISCCMNNDTKGEYAQVWYGTVSQTDYTKYPNTKSGYSYIKTNIDEFRRISRVLLAGLSPNTRYYFRAGYDNTDTGYKIISKEFSFLTTPSSGQTLRIAAAGDIDVNQHSKVFMNHLNENDYGVGFLGGDISYADSAACYLKYDKWFTYFAESIEATAPVPRTLTPLIAAIGNHEVFFGYNGSQFPGGPIQNVPFFFDYFAYEESGVMPHPEGMLTYHTHKLTNNSAVIILDSGHYFDFGPVQSDWLKEQLDSLKSFTTVTAVYHAPMYPSVAPENDGLASRAKLLWLDSFDKAKNVKLLFENHDHTLKRTFPLYQNRIAKSNEKGIVYVGDGCMGHRPNRLEDSKRWYMTVYDNVRNFWTCDVATNGTLVVSALDEKENFVDNFVIQ